MRKYLVIILVFLWAMVLVPRLNKELFLFRQAHAISGIGSVQDAEQEKALLLNEARELLKNRKDYQALAGFEKILLGHSDNLDALWGKAEISRRRHDYQQAEILSKEVLTKNPQHAPALITLAYIRYKDNQLDEASSLISRVLEIKPLDRESRALACMMTGMINCRKASQGGLLSRIKYGRDVKCHFLQAIKLAPDLAEAHMGLGTFALLAPRIAGGNLKKAIAELELAIKIAPDFATANARLAQAYKKQGNSEKYNYYLERAKSLDPHNEVLEEIK